ncbi:MAG: SGNH/GDSL hydrolase family protein [Verrucomicrobiota bacterium]
MSARIANLAAVVALSLVALSQVSAQAADTSAPTAATTAQKASQKTVKSHAAAAAPQANRGTNSTPRNPAMLPIRDEPGLPRVLLIGDSISIGYTLTVRSSLKGKANVHRIPTNGAWTEFGLSHLKEWLGHGKWDVIHFNFGLHDAKYLSETAQRSTREQYAENLQLIVTQLKTTGAVLIFATTTPVPKDGNFAPGRRFDSIPARNEVALKVMRENGVLIDDLYSVALPVLSELGRANDVHWQPAGYEFLGKAVAASIEAQLPKVGRAGSGG